MAEQYLEIDEYKDVEASTEFLLEAIKRSEKNDIYWKQILIFTYLALQGTAVCCLTQTDLTGPFEKRTEKELRLFLNLKSQEAVNRANNAPWEMPELEYPQEKLASFDELLARLPSPLKVKITNKSKKSASDFEWSFIFVRIWRNDFSHFGPKSLLIHKGDIARHCMVCLQHTLKIVKSPEKFANRSRFGSTTVLDNLEKAIQLLSQADG